MTTVQPQSWTCPCGTFNSRGKFCRRCDAPRDWQKDHAFSNRSCYPLLSDMDYAALKRIHETAPRVKEQP